MSTQPQQKTFGRMRLRLGLPLLLAVLMAALALPLVGYLSGGVTPANAQITGDTNPRANYWRAVRGGESGYSAVSGPETGVLIQNGGQNWRQIRDGILANYGGWALVAVIIGLVVFLGLRGPVQIEQGRAGASVARWNAWERFLHWYTAVLFIILALTGLSLLFGRIVLIPLFGPSAFAAWAGIAIKLHNTLGPAFVVGVLLMILTWLPHNLPARGDWTWFKEGGGMVRGRHPSCGKVNPGEKLFVFWLGLMVAGIATCVTGLILDFPNFDQTRETMQLANLIHGSVAIIWMILISGHSYLGSVGIEGALEGMTSGRVDVNFAKQHNDRWYAEFHGGASEEIAPAAEGDLHAAGD